MSKIANSWISYKKIASKCALPGLCWWVFSIEKRRWFLLDFRFLLQDRTYTSGRGINCQTQLLVWKNTDLIFWNAAIVGSNRTMSQFLTLVKISDKGFTICAQLGRNLCKKMMLGAGVCEIASILGRAGKIPVELKNHLRFSKFVFHWVENNLKILKTSCNCCRCSSML